MQPSESDQRKKNAWDGLCCLHGPRQTSCSVAEGARVGNLALRSLSTLLLGAWQRSSQGSCSAPSLVCKRPASRGALQKGCKKHGQARACLDRRRCTQSQSRASGWHKNDGGCHFSLSQSSGRALRLLGCAAVVNLQCVTRQRIPRQSRPSPCHGEKEPPKTGKRETEEKLWAMHQCQ